MHPNIKGIMAKGVKTEVAEPKIMTSGKIKKQSIISLPTA